MTDRARGGKYRRLNHTTIFGSMRYLLLLPILLSMLISQDARALDISGEVNVTEKSKQVRRVEDVIVYYRPDTPVSLDEHVATAVMQTRNKQFSPRVMPIVAGSTVDFPNLDPILHNVFSVSKNNKFDAGLYSEGPGESQQFNNPGLVRVFCNVHQNMVGHILVLDTPWFTEADEQGRFTLTGVPEGKGKLYVWHQRARPVVQEVEISEDLALVTDLKLSKPVKPAHKNKFGKPYRKRRGRDGRY